MRCIVDEVKYCYSVAHRRQYASSIRGEYKIALAIDATKQILKCEIRLHSVGRRSTCHNTQESISLMLQVLTVDIPGFLYISKCPCKSMRYNLFYC